MDDLSSNGGGAASDDEFNNFFSANRQQINKSTVGDASKQATNTSSSSLAQEEADFFNQSVPSESEKAKLTKDSIMALYGRLPSGAAPVQQQQPTPLVQANPNAPTSNVNLLAGLGVGFPGQMTQQINGGFPTQVPNSNGNGSNGSHPFGGLVNLQQGQGQVFGQQQGQQQQQGQFGMQQVPVQMPSQFMNGGGGGFYHNGTGGGIMGGVGTTAQGQGQQQLQGMNFFPANGQMGGFNNNNQQQMMGGQQLQGKGFNGNNVIVGQPQQQQQVGQFPQFGGVAGGQVMGVQPQMGQQGGVMAGGVNGSNGGAAMQKQFGNLNLGNVWQ